MVCDQVGGIQSLSQSGTASPGGPSMSLPDSIQMNSSICPTAWGLEGTSVPSPPPPLPRAQGMFALWPWVHDFRAMIINLCSLWASAEQGITTGNTQERRTVHFLASGKQRQKDKAPSSKASPWCFPDVRNTSQWHQLGNKPSTQGLQWGQRYGSKLKHPTPAPKGSYFTGLTLQAYSSTSRNPDTLDGSTNS